MARLSVGEKLTGSYLNSIYTSPTWVVDTAGSAKLLAPTGYDWFGPQSFPEKFKQLWQVAA
jgi:hypothetical protein